MHIKNIVFDMGGVLVDLNGERCIDAFEAIGAPEVATYVRECRTEDLFYDIEIGSTTTEDFCDEVRRMSACTADNDSIIAAWNALLEPTTSEKRELLLRLKAAGYHLFLLSNTNDMHWQAAKSHLVPGEGHCIEDYFDGVFLSYELGMQKPLREIYEALLNQTGINPDETMFVDDNEVNVHAASQVGIHPFHERDGHRWVQLLAKLLDE